MARSEEVEKRRLLKRLEGKPARGVQNKAEGVAAR